MATATNQPIHNKEAYKEKVKAQIDRIDAKIDELKAKAAGAEAEARQNYNSTIEELSAKRDALAEKFQEFQSSGEQAWQELTQGLDNAWQEVENAFHRATEKFQ